MVVISSIFLHECIKNIIFIKKGRKAKFNNELMFNLPAKLMKLINKDSSKIIISE